MARSKKIERKGVRATLRALDAHDRASVLMFIAPKKLEGQMRVTKAVRRAPLVLPFLPNPAKVKELVAGGVDELNIITVSVMMLKGEPYRVAMGEHSSSTVEAAGLLNVPVPIAYAGQWLCEPEAFTLYAQGDLWALVSDEFSDIRPWNFGSDDIAQVLLALGVKQGRDNGNAGA